MGKAAVCIGENKGADQFHINCEADQRIVFAARIVQPFFLYLKFQASSLLLLLYRQFCVSPGRNPHCRFSHAQAQILIDTMKLNLVM